MSDDERIRRPPLDRTRPIRNWSTLLGTPLGQAGPVENGDGTAGLGDVVSRSVELGYRVVDEYIRQGQRAANRLSAGEYRPGDWAADAQDLAQRMAQYASELAGTWFELLERVGAATTAAAGRSAERTTERTVERPPAPSRAPAPRAQLRLSIDSAVPAQLFVELDVQATGRRLVAHALHACEAWKPRLSEVEFRLDARDEIPTLHVKVPPHQPPGSTRASSSTS
jgi:hypothetical protein